MVCFWGFVVKYLVGDVFFFLDVWIYVLCDLDDFSCICSLFFFKYFYKYEIVRGMFVIYFEFVVFLFNCVDGFWVVMIEVIL